MLGRKLEKDEMHFAEHLVSSSQPAEVMKELYTQDQLVEQGRHGRGAAALAVLEQLVLEQRQVRRVP